MKCQNCWARAFARAQPGTGSPRSWVRSSCRARTGDNNQEGKFSFASVPTSPVSWTRVSLATASLAASLISWNTKAGGQLARRQRLIALGSLGAQCPARNAVPKQHRAFSTRKRRKTGVGVIAGFLFSSLWSSVTLGVRLSVTHLEGSF